MSKKLSIEEQASRLRKELVGRPRAWRWLGQPEDKWTIVLIYDVTPTVIKYEKHESKPAICVHFYLNGDRHKCTLGSSRGESAMKRVLHNFPKSNRDR